ncbi:MAG: hypothetical protein Kow0067_14820 [Coriobacteriia bacterium]
MTRPPRRGGTSPQPRPRPRNDRLAPVRDAGITVGRSRPRPRRKQPNPLMPLILLAIVIVVAMLVAIVRAAEAPRERVSLTEPAAAAESLPAPEPEREPTPLIGCYGQIALRLPVDPADLTAIAFHQASGDRAVHLVSFVADADMTRAAELKAVPSAEETDGAVAQAAGFDAADVLQGCALRLWRSNRTGMPDTAADIGAAPGSIVYSPVSGTVVLVRPYQLYGQHDDFEIHIQPDGHEELDLVIIHIDEVTVAEGDRVNAGATPVAVVRKMSDKIDLQLGGYVPDGGDHVHFQLNSLETPGVLPSPDGS